MSTAVTDSPGAARRARAAHVRGLYAVTPDTRDTAGLAARVAAAIDGGAGIVQYRNKTAAAALAREQAAALVRVCGQRGAMLIVNDDAALAAAVGADGVHLGEDDADIGTARRALGPARIVGASCYDDFERAVAMVAAGADYVAFGSFFASDVKPHARRADITLLQRARDLGVPVVAIGGITADNAATLVRAGAHALAVITAVFGSADPAGVTAASRTLCAALDPRR
jgi:thiamine-phosphate pyrophosphorylase